MIGWLAAWIDLALAVVLPSEPVYEAQRYRSLPSEDPALTGVGTRHLDGVPWWKVPMPPKRHTCWVQTVTWVHLERQHRCGCGAIRRGFFDPWKGKDTRRKIEDERGR